MMQKYDKRIKTKKTLYKGIWFKSNLEARVAEAFDAFDWKWEYEPVCFRDEGFVYGQYTPDFYLTDFDAYIEVAGVWDARHEKNAIQLLKNKEIRLYSYVPDSDLDGYYDGDFCNVIMEPTLQGRTFDAPVMITKCPKCGRWHFGSADDEYPQCPFCGHDIGFNLLSHDDQMDWLCNHIGCHLFAAARAAKTGTQLMLEVGGGDDWYKLGLEEVPESNVHKFIAEHLNSAKHQDGGR